MHLVPELRGNMRSKAAGFTLIETLIVVALVAVMAGISAPVVAGGLARYNLTSAAQQVASTVRSARFQAVGRNARLRIVFTAATGQYSREVWDGAAWQAVTLAGNAAADVRTLPTGISFGAGVPANIVFETDGRTAQPTVITITNGDAAANRTITIGTSGRVTLQ
jgi:type II secretion system protein H